MATIVPAILPSSRVDLESKLAALHGITTDVQIDIVDGRFALPPTWPYITEGEAPQEDQFARHSTLNFEIDLMVKEPELVIGSWITLGASRITVHAESTQYLARLVDDFAARYGYEKDFLPGMLSLGLAINLSTDLALIEPYMDRIDYVQFMGIRRIGVQGEPFDSDVLRKIALFRKKYPTIPVEVDGGVSLASAPDLLKAGVSRLVVGSALWKAPNVAHEYKKFTELVEEYGIYE